MGAIFSSYFTPISALTLSHLQHCACLFSNQMSKYTVHTIHTHIISIGLSVLISLFLKIFVDCQTQYISLANIFHSGSISVVNLSKHLYGVTFRKFVCLGLRCKIVSCVRQQKFFKHILVGNHIVFSLLSNHNANQANH